MNVNGFQQHHVSTNPPPSLPTHLGGGVQQLNVSQPAPTQHITLTGHHVQNASELVQAQTNIKLENGGSSGGHNAGVPTNPSYYACTSYSPPASDPQQHQQQALLTANAYSKPALYIPCCRVVS